MFSSTPAYPYDFLQVDTVDVDGNCRSKILSKSSIPRAMTQGVPMYCGAQAAGFRSEIPPLDDIVNQHYGNGLLKIDSNTIIHKTWSTDKYKLGHALAEMNWFDEKGENPQPHPGDPRAVASRVIKDLRKTGYSFYSAFEYEFQLLNQSDRQPFAKDNDVFYPLSMTKKVMETMMSATSQLEACGIRCDYLHREYCHGQVEIPMSPEFGVKAADNAIRFKSAVKEVALQNDFVATFMTKPFANDGCNGAHFNFSLWNVEGTKNVLFDRNEPNNLSQIGQHWLAGIVHHLPGMTAIMSSTSNCYRRLGKPWTPNSLSWGVENRNTSIRVKNHSENQCYFENRLSSGPVNPYLALAVNVIAGMDGISRELNLPDENEPVAVMPTTFAEALDELEKDVVMMEKLGMLGKLFLDVKRETDLEIFQNHFIHDDREEDFTAERKYFLEMA